MSLPVGLVLCLYPYSGLSSLPVRCGVPMWLLETETGLSGLYCAVEARTVSSPVLLLIGTVLSQNPGIPVSGGNPVSCAQAAYNGSTPSILLDRQLSSVPGPDGRDSEILANQRPSASSLNWRKTDCPSSCY